MPNRGNVQSSALRPIIALLLCLVEHDKILRGPASIEGFRAFACLVFSYSLDINSPCDFVAGIVVSGTTED